MGQRTEGTERKGWDDLLRLQHTRPLRFSEKTTTGSLLAYQSTSQLANVRQSRSLRRVKAEPDRQHWVPPSLLMLSPIVHTSCGVQADLFFRPNRELRLQVMPPNVP